MAISFRTTRNVGLLLMMVVIVAMGLGSFFTTTLLVNSLSGILHKERPELESVESIRNYFLDAREIFRNFIQMNGNDIQPAVALMSEAIKESENLKKLAPSEEKLVNKFITAAKRFRIAIVTYAEEARIDITGARAIEMERIAMSTASDAESISLSLLKDIRNKIKLVEEDLMAIADISRRISLTGIPIGVVVGLLVAFFMGLGLNRPIRKLVDGTQKIAEGDLTHRVTVDSNDEIGRLSAAFNKMTEDLSISVQKEKKLLAAAEAAAENEKKKALALAKEVEERIMVEEELEQSIAELRSTQHMLVQSEKLASLGRLVSEIAHEINNPLMIISGNAQLALMSESVSAEAKKSLDIITDECQRAKSIIMRLLKFSRPSKGEAKEVDINKSIEVVAGILERQFKLADVEIKREYQKDAPLISIDELQIQEVIMNLINNAKDAMPAGGGTITVTTSLERDYVRIDIKDTGSGMSDETKRMVFEPFFTTKEKGTGLGLSISYGIIKAHNGQLELKSELNKGTVVTLLLPLLSKA